tara:strand:- start:52 stop:324 length:273 start_codon:yes stop_codon:yes gene_type:complete
MSAPQSIPYQFVSKVEVFPPDPSSDFVGKHQVTISATCTPSNEAEETTKEFSDFVITLANATDAQYATTLYNALEGGIYVAFGYEDPYQI